MRLWIVLTAAILTTAPAHAQWQIQDSHSTASFRGIHSIGNGIAWASGTEGTVLRTTDKGATWQRCTTPPDAEKLDFRGIQAFDQNTAIVMSSGKGDLSRLYKTTDACKTWKLLFANLDKAGFWDAIQFFDRSFGVLVGDPVNGLFFARWSSDGGRHWHLFEKHDALDIGQQRGGMFAASNSSLLLPPNPNIMFAAANVGENPVIFVADFRVICPLAPQKADAKGPCPKGYAWLPPEPLPGLALTSESEGLFSIAGPPTWTDDSSTFVVVGGDYKTPHKHGIAFRSQERNWTAAQTPPHGYRSSVAYDSTTKTWITVGPNGTDISRDDGKNWSALQPAAQDAPDADKNWNALSLPFVVGPKGRIGKLRPEALKP